MTVIVMLNGPIFWAIWGDIDQYRAISDDIGQFWAILGDIGVISSSVMSVMYLARPIQVLPGQIFF